MAQTAVFNAAPRSLANMALAPFRAVGNFLVTLADASPRMQQITKLNALTDADLAAKGLTRDGEIRRIFGAHFYI